MRSRRKVAVLCAHRYRAESLALTLSQHLNLQAVVVTDPAKELSADFTIILIDLDMGMEVASGLARSIANEHKRARVVLLGVVESEECVLKLAEVGVGGYVSTAASFSDLLAVVRSVQIGEFVCRPDINYALFSHLAELATGDAPHGVGISILTTRERQIYQLMSQRLMNKEIAGRLCLSEHTVKNHVHHILKKLGMRNRAAAVREFYASETTPAPWDAPAQPSSFLNRRVDCSMSDHE